MATHQSTKAAKAFMAAYPNKILTASNEAINQSLAFWWNKNRGDYPLAQLLDVRQNVLSTIEYNKAYPNRK